MKTALLASFAALTTIGVLGATVERGHLTAAGPICVQPLGDVAIEGGTFDMGDTGFYAEEGPIVRLSVEPFRIDAHEITNRQFAKFVAATGYVTSAERMVETGWPANGSAVFDAMQWQFVEGANWRHPEGPHSSIEGRDNDPVVQVSLEDAQAYADWRGRALPTEAEWEYAARGGLDGKPFAWGDVFTPGGVYMANTWQGMFPENDAAEDGHMGRAQVGCFPANGYGLYDMIGNVWEWTEDPYYPDKRFEPPEGVDSTGFDPVQPDIPVAVIKGGSFLCSPDFCGRYRPAARHAQDTGLGTNHIGFRTVSTHPSE
ncbi:MAG: formylglycine-generating enzyme family protein [Paracoccaceae bacterium]|nr:formylglycine-generating enzyme family protein [Paracoccaceae bacterium]